MVETRMMKIQLQDMQMLLGWKDNLRMKVRKVLVRV
jgi:hypothetical protein